jgi:hypothetical protein
MDDTMPAPNTIVSHLNNLPLSLREDIHAAHRADLWKSRLFSLQAMACPEVDSDAHPVVFPPFGDGLHVLHQPLRRVVGAGGQLGAPGLPGEPELHVAAADVENEYGHRGSFKDWVGVFKPVGNHSGALQNQRK